MNMPKVDELTIDKKSEQETTNITATYECIDCGKEVPCNMTSHFAEVEHIVPNTPQFCPVGRGKCTWHLVEVVRGDNGE